MHTTSWRANVLGAFGLALADRLADAAQLAGGRTAGEALVTLHQGRAGLSIDGLAGIIGLSHSGTVRLVDRFERDHLVERRRGADQRSTALYLTPQGHRLARRVANRREAEMHSLLALLTDGEQATLARAAARVLAGLGAAREAETRLCRLCDHDACGRRAGTCPVIAGDTEPNSEPNI